MKRVLVTGAEGFTASHLLPLLRLEDGIRVSGILFRERAAEGLLDEVFRGDILDGPFVRQVVRETRPDRVYHLAAVVPVAQVRGDFPGALRVNVEGTYHLLEAVAAESPGARVLVVGSSDEYGSRSHDEMPLQETDVFSPVNEYGVTKVAQELLARLYHRRRGIALLFTRTFNFTGPGQPPDFVCSSFARQIARLRRLGGGTIEVGNLDVERDFLDIRDVVMACRTILEKGVPGRVYNVCSGVAIPLWRILDILREMAGVPVEVKRDAGRVRPVDIPYLAGDNGRLRGLGWERSYPLEETLKDLLRFWEDRED